jgi:uncharacterized protein GlcG (DUF336 family)
MTLRPLPVMLVLAALTTGLVAPAQAADVNATHRLSAAFAMEIVEGAVAACTKLNYPITAAVVDADGVVQALMRADGAGIHTVQTAQDKAFTASPTVAPAELLRKRPRPLASPGWPAFSKRSRT